MERANESTRVQESSLLPLTDILGRPTNIESLFIDEEDQRTQRQKQATRVIGSNYGLLFAFMMVSFLTVWQLAM